MGTQPATELLAHMSRAHGVIAHRQTHVLQLTLIFGDGQARQCLSSHSVHPRIIQTLKTMQGVQEKAFWSDQQLKLRRSKSLIETALEESELKEGQT